LETTLPSTSGDAYTYQWEQDLMKTMFPSKFQGCTYKDELFNLVQIHQVTKRYKMEQQGLPKGLKFEQLKVYFEQEDILDIIDYFDKNWNKDKTLDQSNDSKKKEEIKKWADELKKSKGDEG
jgi:hypothetical protein